MSEEPKRCPWPGEDAQMIHYHDEEWGVPVRDGVKLFGKLVLDGFQSGLSWQIILRKRDNFLRAFDRFDPEQLVRYDAKKRAALLADAGIVRNRAKIDGALRSARAFVALEETGVRFSDFLWELAGGSTRQNRWKTLSQLPAENAASRTMAKALKERGFAFCGPTVCYAFMQAVGMVNDHLTTCYRWAQLKRGA